MKVVLFFSFSLAVFSTSSSQVTDDASAWLNSLVDSTMKPMSTLNLDTKHGQTDTTDNKCSENNVEGICVKPSHCNLERSKIDPTALFVPRISECHYLQKCCPPSQVRKTETNSCIVDGKIGKCVLDSDCDSEGDSTAKFIKRTSECGNGVKYCCPIGRVRKKKEISGCGFSRPAVAVFRDGSSKYADFGEYPWMVALLKNTSGSWIDTYVGGGTLIHPKVVITVAHKIENMDIKQIKIRAGEWDILSLIEFYPHQERNIMKAVTHSEYEQRHLFNDISLLILDSPFDLTDSPHIGVACLTSSTIAPGTECFSMGWGKELNDEKYAVWLKKIPLPMVSKEVCESQLRKTVLSSEYFLHDSLLCAGGKENQDTCIGDGGSPLVCNIQNDTSRYAVVGMVAYGLDQSCGKKDIPGVYVNLSQFWTWIVTIMTLENINIDTFSY